MQKKGQKWRFLGVKIIPCEDVCVTHLIWNARVDYMLLTLVPTHFLHFLHFLVGNDWLGGVFNLYFYRKLKQLKSREFEGFAWKFMAS